MSDWAIVCLQGTSSVELIAVVHASSLGSAFETCRAYGLQPLRLG